MPSPLLSRVENGAHNKSCGSLKLYPGDSSFTVWTLREGGEWRVGRQVRAARSSGERKGRGCWSWGPRDERAAIGCCPLVRALPLAHRSEPGLLLVAGWPRAKVCAGAASAEAVAGRRRRLLSGCCSVR